MTLELFKAMAKVDLVRITYRGVGAAVTAMIGGKEQEFRGREIIVDVEDEELGRVPMHNIIPRLSKTPGTWRRPAPRLGEHTEEVLREVGLKPSK